MEDLMTMHTMDSAARVRESRSTDRSAATAPSIPTTTNTATASASASENPSDSTPRTVLLRTQSLNSGPSRPRSHGRSASIATSSPKSRKRLTLSFPVLPPGAHATPRSSVHSPATASASPVSSLASPPHQRCYVEPSTVSPEDSTSFLTALAAQERRVLELREELDKAETELGRLKKTWAAHEATKKRHELSLNIASAGRGDYAADLREQLSSPTSREEYQLRKAMASAPGAASNRKVLPSQRHQRTLSLLTSHPPKLPPTSAPQPKRQSSTSLSNPPTGGSPTTVTPRPHSMINLDSGSKRNSQDALYQLAEGFKEGLWTFIQDLREATVGDDLTPSQTVRRSSSRASIRSTTGSSSMGRSAGKAALKDKRESTKRESTKRSEESLIDLSDTWESSSASSSSQPNRWSTSTTLSDAPSYGVVAHSHSRSSTPRTSTSSAASFYKTAHPDVGTPLDASAHGSESPFWHTAMQLRRSAGALMSHVEKSLELAPEEEAKIREERERVVRKMEGREEKEEKGEKGGNEGKGGRSRAATGFKEPEVGTGIVRTRSTKGKAGGVKGD